MHLRLTLDVYFANADGVAPELIDNLLELARHAASHGDVCGDTEAKVNTWHAGVADVQMVETLIEDVEIEAEASPDDDAPACFASEMADLNEIVVAEVAQDLQAAFAEYPR